PGPSRSPLREAPSSMGAADGPGRPLRLLHGRASLSARIARRADPALDRLASPGRYRPLGGDHPPRLPGGLLGGLLAGLLGGLLGLGPLGLRARRLARVDPALVRMVPPGRSRPPAGALLEEDPLLRLGHAGRQRAGLARSL